MTVRTLCGAVLWTLFCFCASARGQDGAVGSIRGVVRDAYFPMVLPDVRVIVVGENIEATTTDQGNYLITNLEPGAYTLQFRKDGYLSKLKQVTVEAGRVRPADEELVADFEEQDEILVTQVSLGGSMQALDDLRMESASLMDSVGADVMSRAGAGDAASALRLVPGATVANGKFAVIRGLPDRYVSSQINGVRLPSADEDTRAVELDQFPSAVIESIQVSKTFTPDQQADASGGAVNVQLKSIPDEDPFFRVSAQVSANDQAFGQDDFLSYRGGGVSTLGKESRNIQRGSLSPDTNPDLSGSWKGAVGSLEENAPTDFKWSMATGGKTRLRNGWKVGGFASLFYEKDSSHIEDAVQDEYWVFAPGDPLTPLTKQGTPTGDDYVTSLFDITESSRTVNWGGLGTVGVESENHKFGVTYLYTRTAEDRVTVATDTRGKAFYFPDFDANDPTSSGANAGDQLAAPFLRTETLQYTERTTHTLQVNGQHTFPGDEKDIGPFRFGDPQVDWYYAQSSADLYQPDKRQFGAKFYVPSFNSGFPPFIPSYVAPGEWDVFKPAANVNLGNLQRIWKEIEETSDQVSASVRFPFTQWSRDPGYIKLGVFRDNVEREFDQESFSNFADPNSSYQGTFDQPWSDVFPSQDHPITASDFDVDYVGEQEIKSWYSMIDLPIDETVKLVAGARFENTNTDVVNIPDELAFWIPPGATSQFVLNPGDADVKFSRRDVLPMLGVEVKATDDVTLRGSISKTVARQTFKELTPIQQQEFLGGPVFVGNPELDMSELTNYDLRADYTPSGSTFMSLSLFRKDIEDPIEQVQRIVGFTYTTAVNYPKGELEGWEFEVRQGLGDFSDALEGLSVGGNITRIEAVVQLPKDETAQFADPSIDLNISERDMTNAPDFLYNLYTTYDLERTQFSLYWTVKGDTLIAGAGQATGNFVPDVYAKEFGTLNFSAAHRLGETTNLRFQAKNLTNPDIEEVYRFQGAEAVRSSFTRGREYSISLSGRF